MTDLQLGGGKPFSAFLSMGEDAVYQEATSSSHANGVGGTLIRLYRRGPLVPKSTIPMVVFASLAAVVVLILKCVAASRGGRAPKVVKRSLADSEESSPPGSGVVCGVEAGSSDSSSPEQPGSGTEHEEETGEPPSKRQRLDSGPTDGATGGTSRSPGEIAAAEALLLLTEQSSGPSPSGPGITPIQQPTQEKQKTLLAPVPARESYPLLARFLSSTGERSTDPQPSTSAAAAGGSSPGGNFAGSPHRQSQQQETVESSPAERPKDSQQPLQPPPPPSALEETAAGVPSGASDSPSSPQPSTSSGLPSQMPDSAQARRVHAFARLPRVGQERECVRSFNPEFAMAAWNAGRRSLPLLRKVRQILAKDRVSGDELLLLVRLAECLVAHCVKYETRDISMSSPADTVPALGRRFMLLDAVVSTLQLLGERRAGEWWDRFTAAVPHVVPIRRLTGGPLRRFNRELEIKLVNAIEILETGARPPTKDLVEVKRMLFCMDLSPPYFKDPEWDPWRQDDEDARRYNDAED